MKNKNIGVRKWLFGVAMIALSVQFARASDVPLVSGFYQVVRDRASDSQLHIQMRVHLVNNGASDLAVQRMTLWDLPHPDRGGTRACAISLRAHASVETVQQFTIRPSDYQLWQRGSRPRLVLQIAGPGGRKSKTVVRLDRISGREAK
jgi:hypothetical protein